MHIRLKIQCLYMSILIMLMFSGSFLFTRNRADVYYVRTTTRTTEPSFSATPVKHVTKSLSELGKMDDLNKYVLLLNPIPNCGGEVLVFLLQKMQGPNNYRHVRLKGGTKGRRLEKIEQEAFVHQLYEIMRKEAVPLSFDRQLGFINFTLFDRQSPTYINLIREPADKLLSRSLYQRKRPEDGDYYSRGNSNRTRINMNPEELTIPYFCGQEPECLSDKEWALQTAKRNVEKYYPVVGVLEEMNTTLEVLEYEIPYFFKGVQDVYKNKMLDKFVSKKNLQPLPKTRKRLKRLLAQEYEFYNWIKRRLFRQLQMQTGGHSSY